MEMMCIRCNVRDAHKRFARCAVKPCCLLSIRLDCEVKRDYVNERESEECSELLHGQVNICTLIIKASVDYTRAQAQSWQLTLRQQAELST